MLATCVMLCFAGFLRYDDAQRLLVKHVQFGSGFVQLFLPSRKNDQVRMGNVLFLAAGQTLACPVRLLQRYLEAVPWSSDPEAPLFQGFDGQAVRKGSDVRFSGRPLEYGQAKYQVMKYAAKVLGVSQEAATKRFGLHSLRSGGATAVAQSRAIEERLFQAHGGWRSRAAMTPYLQEALEAKLGVTQAIGY